MMFRKTFLSWCIVCNVALYASTDTHDDAISHQIDTLIARIKHSSGDARRQAVNRLKLFLRRHNTTVRQHTMQRLRKTLRQRTASPHTPSKHIPQNNPERHRHSTHTSPLLRTPHRTPIYNTPPHKTHTPPKAPRTPIPPKLGGRNGIPPNQPPRRGKP